MENLKNTGKDMENPVRGKKFPGEIFNEHGSYGKKNG
jgi:hypothetical protein